MVEYHNWLELRWWSIITGWSWYEANEIKEKDTGYLTYLMEHCCTYMKEEYWRYMEEE